MKTITLYDMNYKPIAIISLDETRLNHLHRYHVVQIPVPQEPMTVIPPDDGVVPVCDPTPVVTLERVSTDKGWHVVSNAPLDLLMQLPQAVEYPGASAVNTFRGMLHSIRKEDGQANHAYNHNRLMVLLSPQFHDEIRADPDIRSITDLTCIVNAKPKLNGMRFLIDQHQDVPLKFVMEV